MSEPIKIEYEEYPYTTGKTFEEIQINLFNNRVSNFLKSIKIKAPKIVLNHCFSSVLNSMIVLNKFEFPLKNEIILNEKNRLGFCCFCDGEPRFVNRKDKISMCQDCLDQYLKEEKELDEQIKDDTLL